MKTYISQEKEGRRLSWQQTIRMLDRMPLLRHQSVLQPISLQMTKRNHMPIPEESGLGLRCLSNLRKEEY